MASFSDNFNRADGAVGSNWTTLTSMNALQVVSNSCRSTAGIAGGHVATATATFAADHEAECDIPTFNAFDRAGPGVRLSGNSGYIAYAFSATSIRINRVDAGVLTQLGSAYTWAGSGLVRIRAEGTTITMYVDDVEVLSVTDATYATGQPGLYYDRGDSSSTILDDFYATDLGGGGGLGFRSYYTRG